MHSYEFMKDDKELDQWNKLVKKMFGDDSYVNKEESYFGPEYQVFARFYPAAILGLKGKGKTIEDAVEKAKITIERYKNGGVTTKAPVTSYKGIEL